MHMSFVPDTQNKEFQDALNLIQYTRQSVFLTGKAGTGKSTFLRYICEHTKKKHVVLAPTGIAAINAGGSTLHSFFKLPFYPLLPDDPNFSLQRGRIHEFFKYTKPHRKLLEELELVIIDEISMVRADIIDAVDRILRVYSRNLREPFGGKQILLVGDVFQLEPVVKGDEREILNRFYPTPYFFSARVFGQIDLVSIELQTVYRQTDKVFVNVLDHIRSNTVGAADLQLLNTRYGTQIEQSEADMYITLATRRDNVDYINDKKLAELPGDPVTFHGEIMGDFPESSLPTSQELVLKPGAQIIFIKNDFDRRWVNGTIGIVSGFDPIEETLYIITDDGKECDVKRESWRNIRYKYNEEKKQIEDYDYDCILLDIMLPDGSGLDLLEKLKKMHKRENVIILSAKDSIEDKVLGLDLGADDYLPKPFHLVELNARIKSVIRRHQQGGENSIKYGNIEIFPDKYGVTVAGKKIELNRKEYDILVYFMNRPGRLVNKNTLAESVWGDHIDQVDNFDFIYAQIKNLRKRLKEAGATPELKAVYGFGYKMVVE